MDSGTDFGSFLGGTRIRRYFYDLAVSRGFSSFDSRHSLTHARFYELSRNLDVQEKVRKELLGVGLDCDVRTLIDLPYTNAVVHESLRLHSTSGQTIRFSFADDVIPLSQPINGHNSIVFPIGEYATPTFSSKLMTG